MRTTSDAKPSGSVAWRILLLHSVSMSGQSFEVVAMVGTHCSIISSGNLSNGFAQVSEAVALLFEPELSVLAAGESSMMGT